MSWYGNIQRHALASRGILSKNGSKGVIKNESFNFIGARYDVYMAAKIIEKKSTENYKCSY